MELIGLFVFNRFTLGLCIGMCFAMLLERNVGRDEERKKAVIAGVGKYQPNRLTGKTEFVYITK